jgi:hypothetical protein
MKYVSKRIRSSGESVARTLDDYEVYVGWKTETTILRPKNPNITKAYIPKEVISIDESAFDGCRSLREVEFARGTGYVNTGERSFANTPNLKRIINNRIRTISDRCFENSGIEEFVAPIVYINSYGFSNCRNLRRIEVTEAAELHLWSNALNNCPKLEILSSDGVVTVEQNPVNNCPLLTIDAETKDALVSTWGTSTEKSKIRITKKGSGPISGAWDLLPEAGDIENITELNGRPELDVNVGDEIMIDSDSEILNEDYAIRVKKIHEKSLVGIELSYADNPVEYLGVIATVDVLDEDDEVVKRNLKLFFVQMQDSSGQSAGTYAISGWR